MINYKIKRGCLWFAPEDIVTLQNFRKYFSQVAIEDLIKWDYIEVTTLEEDDISNDFKNCKTLP